jgi:hypothetical protein
MSDRITEYDFVNTISRNAVIKYGYIKDYQQKLTEEALYIWKQLIQEERNVIRKAYNRFFGIIEIEEKEKHPTKDKLTSGEKENEKEKHPIKDKLTSDEKELLLPVKSNKGRVLATPINIKNKKKSESLRTIINNLPSMFTNECIYNYNKCIMNNDFKGISRVIYAKYYEYSKFYVYITKYFDIMHEKSLQINLYNQYPDFKDHYNLFTHLLFISSEYDIDRFFRDIDFREVLIVRKQYPKCWDIINCVID